MLNSVHKWKVVLVNCSSFQLDWPLEICLISWIHVFEKSLIFCCKILWFIFWCWNSWIIKSWETTFRIALNFANLPWFYSTYLIEKKTFPQFHFQRNHTVLPSPETSFLANFTNNWSFSIEIDFCAKYWRNPISALIFLLSALKEYFADIAEVCSMATKTFQADFCAKYWYKIAACIEDFRWNVFELGLPLNFVAWQPQS